MDDIRRFWEEHYVDVVRGGQTWLDYSNERVQLQTFGLTLEASAGVVGKHCLDVGSGYGQLSRALAILGGRVTAIDMLADIVERLRVEHPSIEWRVGNILEAGIADALPVCDRVFAVESLQCVPWRTVLPSLWKKVAAGGRLVAMIPHGDCPIVRKTIERYPGVYSAPTMGELASAISELDAVESWSARGLTFGADQRLHPYDVSGWMREPRWTTPPNRLQFVIARSAAS